jgi:integrase
MKRRRRAFPNVFFKKELVTLFDAIENPKTMMASFMAFFCALRISEVAKLRWTDIDLENMRLKVVEGKNYKDGFIPISSVCIPVLRQWRNMNPDEEYFLPSEIYGMPHYTKSGIFKDYLKALKKAGLYNVTHKDSDGRVQHQYKFHTLRHSRCTHLLNNGVPIEKVQHFMRHDEIDTTLTYTWILDTELNRMVEGVDTKSRMSAPLNADALSAPQKPEDPIDIAKRRLVYGEISPKEYSQIVQALQG